MKPMKDIMKMKTIMCGGSGVMAWNTELMNICEYTLNTGIPYSHLNTVF